MHITLIAEVDAGEDSSCDAADLLADRGRLQGKRARGYEMPLVPEGDLGTMGLVLSFCCTSVLYHCRYRFVVPVVPSMSHSMYTVDSDVFPWQLLQKNKIEWMLDA